MPDITINDCRPEVLSFAVLMEERLREKDAERGSDLKAASMDRLGPSLLIKAIEVEKMGNTKDAVDLANDAMMIVNLNGNLEG